MRCFLLEDIFCFFKKLKKRKIGIKKESESERTPCVPQVERVGGEMVVFFHFWSFLVGARHLLCCEAAVLLLFVFCFVVLADREAQVSPAHDLHLLQLVVVVNKIDCLSKGRP